MYTAEQLYNEKHPDFDIVTFFDIVSDKIRLHFEPGEFKPEFKETNTTEHEINGHYIVLSAYELSIYPLDSDNDNIWHWELNKFNSGDLWCWVQS